MGKNFLRKLIDPSEDSEFWFEDLSIMHYLKTIDKEHIVFNYGNLQSFEDLQLFCKYILGQSILGLNTTKKALPKVRFTTPVEKSQSLKAIKEKTTNFKADDVSYTISDLGFRLENPLDFISKGIGVFGCSITYGIGMPAEQTFCGQLQNTIGLPVYNFGIPGAGIQKITKAFIALNKQFKLKTAIFVLPSMHRFEFIGLEEYDEMFSEAYVPDFDPVNPKRKAVYDLIYTNYDDLHFFNECIKDMTLIKENAKIHGTEVHFLTWDRKFRILAADYRISDLTKYRIVEFPELNEKTQGVEVKDFARDGLHPGLRSHTAIANYLYYAIFREKELRAAQKPKSQRKMI